MTILDVVVLLIHRRCLRSARVRPSAAFHVAAAWWSIALGFVGAVLGMWLARQLGLPEILRFKSEPLVFPIVWSL